MNLEWFHDERNVESIPVLELMESLCGEVIAKSIGLPVFQREAVWDDGRVELLWDSLLRGFPIGSLLFVSSRDDPKSSTARLLQESAAQVPPEATEKHSIRWLLIDGQQRCMSIALGNRRNENKKATARLWLDLGEVGPKTEKRFPFYLCTRAHPWGREATESEKRRARVQLKEQTELWNKALGSVDSNDRYPDRWLDLEYTWPVKARQPIPVAELIGVVVKNGDARELSLDELKTNVRHLEWWKGINPEDGTILECLKMVEKAFNDLQHYRVVAIRVPPSREESEFALGEIFTRLNRQGVTMTGGDLFYSALKAEWPDAHNLVTHIYTDEDTGRVLSPVQIVHAATRLVVVSREKNEAQGHASLSDPVSLDLQTFRSLKGEDTFLQGMEGYLKPSDRSIGRLHQILRTLRDKLRYRPNGEVNDPGLPLPLLARLNWHCWHILMAWADGRTDGEVEAESDGDDPVCPHAPFLHALLSCAGDEGGL